MSMSEQFQAAVRCGDELKRSGRVSEEHLLRLYALYNQATVGNNNTPSPIW